MKNRWSFLFHLIACHHEPTVEGVKATLFILWLLPVFAIHYTDKEIFESGL